MKKIVILTVISLSALLLAASCNREMPVNDTKVNAAIESMTRTQLAQEGDIYKVNWVAGDRIAVTSKTATAFYKADNGGSPVSSFSPDGSAISGSAPFTAWYPASLAEGNLPAVQQYKAGGIFEAPMCADSENLDFNFRNLCGAIRLDIATSLSGIKLDRIVLDADQGLSGNFNLDGGEAVVTSSDGVRLDCGGVALGPEAASFYISVPANTYTGLTITLFTSDGLSQQISLKEGATYKVERSQVCEISVTANDFAANHYDAAVLLMGNDVNQLLKSLSGTTQTVSTGDSIIRRIVIETGSKVSKGLRGDAYNSPYPIYFNWDKASGTVTISTPAGSIRTGKMCAHMFAYLYTLEEIVNLNLLDTSDAEDMGSMFKYAGCRVENPKFDVSRFNTSNVRVFYHMFYYCQTVEELNVSGFDGSSAVNLDNMFRNCVKLKALDLSSFNTPNATTFRSLFNRCDSIEELDLDNMETGKGELMTYMFYGMKSLRKLSIRKFDVNRADASITYMFSHCPNLTEIHLGDGFLQNNTTPTYFFLGQSDAVGTRTASLSKKLTIYCNQATANWLAKTNLRWIHSGYSGKTPIDVVFIDNATGNTLNPTWAAN